MSACNTIAEFGGTGGARRLPSVIPTMSPQSHRGPPGFTLVELMVVIAVIMALMATFFVSGFSSARERAAYQRTELLVTAVATAIDAHDQRYFLHRMLDEADGRLLDQRSYPLWDLPADPTDITTRDGLLDGTHVEEEDGTWRPFNEIYPGYRGFVVGVGFDHQPEDLYWADTTGDGEGDQETGMLMDSWGQPLRIRVFDPEDTAAFGSPPVNPFGAQWYGVWSAGPDGIDDTEDDITSWDMRSGQ